MHIIEIAYKKEQVDIKEYILCIANCPECLGVGLSIVADTGCINCREQMGEFLDIIRRSLEGLLIRSMEPVERGKPP